MFNYFGSKRGNAKHYPKPRYQTIIEPFAGAAGYSCLYFQKQVILNDLDPKIAEIWQWIISATDGDVNGLPDVQPGESLDSFNLPRVQKNLLSLVCNRGRTNGGNTYQGWATRNGGDLRKMKLALAKMDFSKWRMTNLDYTAMPNQEATWFIDAPYFREGRHYKYHAIDYVQLAQWCKSRKGQVIVCEAAGADWLPFRPSRYRYFTRGIWKTETIWSNE